ncbi:MAG: hypothetical protein M1829_002625 [Trizodia sp. TS-e1964]|nr:MAG: hypothetical protein M1829_002625 [Trizodia sp. TS-e1964]
MDPGDPPGGEELAMELDLQPRLPKRLPDDLPTSLNDRRAPLSLEGETEMYDAWQGQSQFLTNPIPARPLTFNLTLDEPNYQEGPVERALDDSDSRLMEMLAAQAAHRDGSILADEDAIVTNEKLSDDEKRDTLQKALNMAASNGDVERIQRLIGGNAKTYIDINAPDEEGTAPLIYASCFGHEEVVAALIAAGANVDKQDRNQWSALMWAMTNRHKGIAKLLLDNGASPEVKSSSGRTAFDFIQPNSEISDYLHESGYNIGNVGVGDDFYDTGFSQDRFEEEMAENEMKRRMMMESARDLEVDLSSLGLDEQPESPDGMDEEQQDFVWDKCLHDQMFVFQENELGRILDIIITHMTPQRSPSQKPVPANILFLSARYAHYHSSPDLLGTLLVTAMDKINDVVEKFQWDMTILAFWISNATLLLHYLKKDAGLVEATTEFQLQLAELINEIFILIIRDAERRMDKVLDTAILEHETIPGFENVQFQNEWRLFKSKPKVKTEPSEKRFRPPSPKRRAQTSPRNITSLLSSTLFVLDLYDIHSVITSQILAQLMYWLGAELFNRIMSNRRYLARTKAMQIRMNISILEDWARSNNRQPEHYENGSMNFIGEETVEATRKHLAPLIQLLQWLQCFSSIGDDFQQLVGTIQQLTRLSPQQLIHAVKHYRIEVGEKGLTKNAMKYLLSLQKEIQERKERQRRARPVSVDARSSPTSTRAQTPITPAKGHDRALSEVSTPPSSTQKPLIPDTLIPKAAPMVDIQLEKDEDEDSPENLLLDPALMLPFSLPTSTDMLISYGAGFGGLNRERERKYIPTVPPEFLAKLDLSASSSGDKNGAGTYEDVGWDDEEI